MRMLGNDAGISSERMFGTVVIADDMYVREQLKEQQVCSEPEAGAAGTQQTPETRTRGLARAAQGPRIRESRMRGLSNSNTSLTTSLTMSLPSVKPPVHRPSGTHLSRKQRASEMSWRWRGCVQMSLSLSPQGEIPEKGPVPCANSASS